MLYEVITCLVISPLIALMNDQVDRLNRIRITSYNVCYTKLLRIHGFRLAVLGMYFDIFSFYLVLFRP